MILGLDSGLVPDSRLGLIMEDFGLSQLVQCFFDFGLSVVCSYEDGNVLHAGGYETGEKPFAWCELKRLLKNLLVDGESVANDCSIIWSGQSPHKIRMQLLQRVRV